MKVYVEFLSQTTQETKEKNPQNSMLLLLYVVLVLVLVLVLVPYEPDQISFIAGVC